MAAWGAESGHIAVAVATLASSTFRLPLHDPKRTSARLTAWVMFSTIAGIEINEANTPATSVLPHPR